MQDHRDTIVIYHSPEDGCWLAHSLETDQIGDGESVLEALECLMRGLKFLHAEAAKDATLRAWRKASDEIFAMSKAAKPLPGEIMDIACKRVHGVWPADLPVKVDPDTDDGPYTASKPDELVTA